jgi:predicted RNA-binding Zn ribbon-like protein
MTDQNVEAYHLIGGRLCLDFSNTAGDRGTAEPEEWLWSYAAFVNWSQYAGVLTGEHAERLRRAAADHPAEAAATLERAISIREAIYRILSAVAADRPPDTGDLDRLNASLAEAMPHLRVVQTADGFGWAWDGASDALDRMLWPIMWSVVELLKSDELTHVRECANDHCSWLFLDLSRNHSRRWCDMRNCGNLVKARRHYARHSASRK